MGNIREHRNDSKAIHLGVLDMGIVARVSTDLTDRQFRALMVIRSYEGPNGFCFASQETLAGHLGIRPRQWRDHQKALVKKGFLEIKRRKNDTSLLRTVLPETVQGIVAATFPQDRQVSRQDRQVSRHSGTGPAGGPADGPAGDPPPSTRVLENDDDECETSPSGGEASSQLCPDCGGRLIQRSGPSGAFLGCSNYRSLNCRYTRDLPNSTATIPTARCDRCGKFVPEDDLEIIGTANDGRTQWRRCGVCRKANGHATTGMGNAGDIADDVLAAVKADA